MAEDIFMKLTPETMRTLLRINPAFQVPVVLISPSFRVLSYNEKAKQRFFATSKSAPSAKKWLSPRTKNTLDQFFLTQSKQKAANLPENRCSLLEWEDGIEYQIDILPHSDGALLVFYYEEHTRYDGSLRIMQLKIIEVLTSLLIKMEQMKADTPKNKKHTVDLEKQCLRLYRLIKHMEFLHEPPNPAMIIFRTENLVTLCRNIVEKMQPKITCTLVPHFPPSCWVSVDKDLIKIALYNLLVNAVQVSPPEGVIEIILHNTTNGGATITITNQGEQLTAEQFESFLNGWKRVATYRTYVADQFGFGLPVVQRIAQLHEGQLLFSPREEGGNAIHFNIGYIGHCEPLEFHQPLMYISRAYSLEDIELSAL